MFNAIFDAVKTLATLYGAPFTRIEHGALPPDNALAIYPGPGTSGERDFARGSTYEVPMVLNGKHSNLVTLVTAMSNIHRALASLSDYPKADDWQILSIDSATPPNYLDRGASEPRQWLYGSILSVKFYIKGV